MKIQCNTFNAPVYKYNIYVTSGTLGTQGSGYSGPDNALRSRKPAGNLFSTDCDGSGGTEKQIKNISGVNIDYYYHNTTGYIPITNCYASDVSPYERVVFDYMGYESCPSNHTPCIPGGGGKLAANEAAGDTTGARMLANAAELQEIINEENAKIDNGNTETLVSEIITGTNEAELYNSLKDGSPYLSNKVMTTLLETDYAMNTYSVLDVLDDNDPLHDSLAVTMLTSEYEIPATVADALTNDTVIVSGEIQIKESEMQQLQDYVNTTQVEKLSNLEQAAVYYLREGKTDSAFIAIETDNTNPTWKLQQEVEIKMNTTDFSGAQAAVNNIVAVNEELSDYKQLQTIQIVMQQNDVSIDSTVAQNTVALEAIAGKYTASGVAAGNALKLQEGKHEVYAEIFDEDIEEDILEIKLTQYTSGGHTFTLYPNPAEDIVYIQLNGVNTNCCNLLNIYDITGKKIRSEKLEPGFIVTWINTSSLHNGIYFIELVSDDMPVETQKLVIE